MKILVTGGTGFIGTNLIKRLVSEGHQVESLDDYSIGLKSNEIVGCKYISLDIEHIDKMGGDYDLCFHLAGLSRIQPSFNDPMETFRVNTEGTQMVMEWALKNDVKVIYAGSSSKHHDPYQSPYATYKYLGEEICKMYRKVYNLHIDIVRFYNVYGSYEVVDGDWAAVIGIWRRQVRDGEPLTIVGDGEQRRDFTHVDDIVDGLIKISKLDYYHEDAWELGTGVNYSINEVAQMFVDKFGCKLNYISNQHGNYRQTLRYSDDSIKELNWNPKDNLKKYIYSL